MTGKGLYFGNDAIVPVNLLNRESRTTYLHSQLIVDANGSIKGTAAISFGSVAAIRFKKSLREGDSEKVKDVIVQDFPEFLIENIEIKKESSGKNSSGFSFSTTIDSDDHVYKSDNKLFLDCIPFGSQGSNPYNDDKRILPIEFDVPINETLIFQYSIPEGYKVIELPEPIILKLPENSASFTFNVGAIGNTVQVTSKVAVNQTIFQPTEWPSLNRFYSEVISKQASQIILEKEQ